MWAVVPVKDLTLAKQRLGSLLSPAERRGLSLAMLSDVLAALRSSTGIEGSLIVTHDIGAESLAQTFGASVLREEESGGLSQAATRAAVHLRQWDAVGLMVVPGDVPLLRSSDIEKILAVHRPGPAMTIVPDRREEGSNCVACSPPNLIPFAYGPGSFKKHLAAARRGGAATQILRLPGLALDIDTPGDLRTLISQPAATRAHTFLREHGIDERLRKGEMAAMEESGS